MSFHLKGRVEWELVDSVTLEKISEGGQDNILLDNGRRNFIAVSSNAGGWALSGGPYICLSSGSYTPDFEDMTIPNLHFPLSTSAKDSTITWTPPTVSYTASFPSSDSGILLPRTIPVVGLSQSNPGSQTVTNPNTAVLLASPIVQGTIEKYPDD